MDINTIVQDYFAKPSTIEEKSPKNSSSNDALDMEYSDLQKDALLAVKRDPAVLEVKVTTDQDKSVFSFQKVLQAPNNPNGFRPQVTPESSSSEFNHRLEFERKLCTERTAMLSLPPTQLSLLLKYVATLRQQRISLQKRIECAFCKNNRQPEMWYNTHALKDAKRRVVCPILRLFICPLCGATGDHAHTISHCPLRKYGRS